MILRYFFSNFHMKSDDIQSESSDKYNNSKNDFQPMDVKTSEDGANRFNFSQPFQFQDTKFLFLKLVLFKIFVVTFFIYLFGFFTKVTPTETNIFSNNPNRPLNLRTLMHLSTKRSIKSIFLSTIIVNYDRTISDQDLTFIILSPSISNTMIKDNVDTNIIALNSNNLRSSSLSVMNTVGIDRLDITLVPKELIITPIDSSYTLILNKYNTINDHALLVSNEFIDQSAPLTSNDFDAWYWCLVQANAVGFYNSDYNAGASQAHRHFQVIPMDGFNSYRDADLSATYPLPLDDAVMPLVRTSWQPFQGDGPFYRLEQFQFVHCFVKLPKFRSDVSYLDIGDYLLDAFEAMADSLGQQSFNLILTPYWMLLVPRLRRGTAGLDVNCFAFTGFLLIKNATASERIGLSGPLSLLRQVTYPLNGRSPQAADTLSQATDTQP